jgi:uncharacterized protein YkwD
MKSITLKVLPIVLLSLFLYSCDSDEDGIYMETLQDAPLNYTPMEYEILTLVNQHRESLGLSILEILNYISIEAIDHNNYMIDKGEASHDNFPIRCKSLIDNIEAQKVGENVAYGYSNAKSVVSAWMHSEGHRHNIENEEYTHFGISAMVDNEGKMYFTNIFVKKR